MSNDDVNQPRPDDHTALATLWVLHALDVDQEAEFLVHLDDEGCADCAAVVAETAGTLEALAYAVPQEEPPADLRYRLLLAAEAERPVVDDVPAAAGVPATGAPRGDRRDGRRGLGPVRSDGSRSGGLRAVGSAGCDETSPAPLEPAPADETSATVVPLRRRPLVRRALTAVAAAAAVVVIGGLVVNNQSLRDERDQQAATAQQYDRIVDVMRDAGAPGAVSAPLAAASGGGLVGMVVDQGSGPEVLSTALEANEPDETYVLWAVNGPTPTAMGTFDVPGGAASVRSVPSTAVVGPVAGYAVSLEPGRSAPATPTRIVASGQVGR